MRFQGGRPSLFVIGFAAMLLLLPILAVLQYRWIGEVSQAGRERMEASLHSAVNRFNQDFTGELTRAYMAVQVWPTPPEKKGWSEYAQRYADWRASAQNRNVIRQLYLAIVSEEHTLDLRAANPESARMEPVEWPERFLTLKKRLEARSETGWRSGLRGFGRMFDQEAPAMVAPLLRFPLEAPKPGLPPRHARVIGWLITELDLGYLQRELFPELVQKHFAHLDGLDYQVQIVTRAAPQKVIFQTDPKLPAGFFSKADALVNLLEMRPPDGFLRGRADSLRAKSKTASSAAFRRGSAGPPSTPPEENGQWQLLVKSRTGSLETVVAETRYRNLTISGAILMLMAAGLGMLVVSTQRAQRLARLQMEFVAGVSHELRTPLTVICSAGDNLADGLVASAAQVQKYGAVIRNEGRRLSEMVEQILRFAGIQSGRDKYDLEPVETVAIIARALDACGPQVREAGCLVEQKIAPDLPLVLGDETALTHCVRNLLSNAVKYGKGGGRIGVRAEAAQGEKGSEVQVSIEDDGLGIEPADLPHIFEPFYRGQIATAAQIHGAGLGLSLVKRIMEAHGGKVTVKSEPGAGSCFTLHLPVAASTVEAASEEVKSS